jgi:hypothetical protein
MVSNHSEKRKEVEKQMNGPAEVNFHLNVPAEKVLRDIRSATEREKLPFISASRFPQQTEKQFVSSVSGSRFRIWKVPSSSRRRQNVCIPYLHGTVRDVTLGSTLTGSFALHPFNKLLLVLPFVVVSVPWLLRAENTAHSTATLTLLSVFFLCIELALIYSIKRLRPAEEKDLVQFLTDLLSDAHSPSTRDSAPG